MFDAAVAQKRIPLDDIVFDAIKIREPKTDDPDWNGFLNSIRLSGVQVPILVRPFRDEEKNIVKGKWEGVDGCQRVAASRLLKLDDIPANVVEYDDETCQALQLILNRNRIKQTKREELNHVIIFMQRHPQFSQSDVAERLNYTQTDISNLLGLKNLSSKVAAIMDAGQLVPTKAMALSKLPEEDQNELLEKALTLPVNDLLEVVKVRKKQLSADIQGKKGDVIIPRRRKQEEYETKLAELVHLVETTDQEDEKYPIYASGKLLMEWCLKIDAKTIADEKAEHEASKAKTSEEKEKAKVIGARKIIEEYEKQEAAKNEAMGVNA